MTELIPGGKLTNWSPAIIMQEADCRRGQDSLSEVCQA